MVLGMEVRRDRQKQTLEIVHTAYIKQMLEHFGMVDCNPIGSPPRAPPAPSRSCQAQAGRVVPESGGGRLWSLASTLPLLCKCWVVIYRLLVRSTGLLPSLSSAT